MAGKSGRRQRDTILIRCYEPFRCLSSFAPMHAFAETLLQPAAVALNSKQSLRTGEHGLELRIAPDFVGQHTLEMANQKTEKEKKRIKKDYQLRDVHR